MKKNLIYLAGALLSSAILMLSCSEENLPSYAEMAVDKTDVFIQADGNNPTAEVNVTAGNGNYKINVADENIATATVDGSRILFKGLKNGTTTATVMDWAKRSVVIAVKVKEDFELQLSKENVTLFLDEENQNKALVDIISGNGEYKVESSNPEVAIAELNEEGKILITGLSSDFCNITVTDADGNKRSIEVGVCDAHLVLESIVGKACIIGQSMDIQVTTGNDGYSVVSENTGIATAEIVEGVIKVTGVAKGETNITVTDRMKQTATVSVKVAGGFEIATTHIDTVFIGNKKQEIAIIDGSGNYTINAGSSINCTLSDDKTKLIIEGIAEKMNRDQTIKITDNILQTSIDISVNWVDYDFYNDYGIARYFIEGKYVKINNSEFQTDGVGRKRIRVGTSMSGWGSNKKVANGYFIGSTDGLEPGFKTNNITLYKITSTGADGANVKIDDMEILRREASDGDKGKYWIRFHESGKTEWSYIVTWL